MLRVRRPFFGLCLASLALLFESVLCRTVSAFPVGASASFVPSDPFADRSFASKLGFVHFFFFFFEVSGLIGARRTDEIRPRPVWWEGVKTWKMADWNFNRKSNIYRRIFTFPLILDRAKKPDFFQEIKETGNAVGFFGLLKPEGFK